MTPSPEPLRLSISLSGGASLGAFHAGVLAALTTAVQDVQRDGFDLRLDAIGGASAGALASMFAAHGLLNGIDTAELLYQAWVEQVSLRMLDERGAHAPLGFGALRRRLPSELEPARWPASPGGPQTTPVGLHVSLTGLRGLQYALQTADKRTIPAITYADWGEFVLQPGGGVQQLLEPEDASVIAFVLASAANPAGFAPQLLNRSDDRDAFADRGIDALPGDGHLWYTDGSSISSEPIGRVLALANRVDEAARDARRIHLMVDPLSETPDDPDAWTGDGDRPTWLSSVSRTLSIMPEQILQDDLRRVQHVNRRVERLDRLVEALAGHLDEDAVAALHRVLDDDDLPSDSADDAPAVLREVVARVAGLHGKSPVHLDLISPLLLTEAHGRDVPGMLAGEIMGDFGGFVHATLRRSDFALGYDCALTWLPDGLRRAGVPDDVIDTGLDAVRRSQRHPWHEVEQGRASLSDLPWRSRLELVRLGLHTIRVIGNDIWRAIRG